MYFQNAQGSSPRNQLFDKKGRHKYFGLLLGSTWQGSVLWILKIQTPPALEPLYILTKPGDMLCSVSPRWCAFILGALGDPELE